MFKEGAHTVLDGKVDIAYEQIPGVEARRSPRQKMAAAITALGKDNIAGVYSANDGMAGGIITALKAARHQGIPVDRPGRRARRHPAHRRR